MSLPDWRENPLGRHHDRVGFDCGDTALNEYLRRYARQNHESGGAKCFVAAPAAEPVRVLGFYTISPTSVEYDRVPAAAKKGLGRYDIPMFRLGRLAVDRGLHGCGLGGMMFANAAERCFRAAREVGGVALLIDAKNDSVAKWYAAQGALSLLDAPLSLVWPLAMVASAIDEKRR